MESSGRSAAAEAARRPPKTAVLVAQRIVRDVCRSNLQPGDFLPSVGAMQEELQCSRPTLKEALRLLEYQGVIELRTGARRGPRLRSPIVSQLASTVVLLMEMHQAPFDTIVEVRTAIEPMV